MFNTERKTKFNTKKHKRQREDYNMNDNGSLDQLYNLEGLVKRENYSCKRKGLLYLIWKTK